VAKSGKLSRQELIERKQRIPQRTQEILRRMIARRQAELCSNPANGGRRPLSYLPELTAEIAVEPAARLGHAGDGGD
jgi:hypothetical protein